MKETSRKGNFMKKIGSHLSVTKANVGNIFRVSRTQTKFSIKIAWKNVTRSKYRTFLLIFGMILTVGLETGIAISVDTLYEDFLLDHRRQNYTDITVSPKTWTDLTNLTSTANKIRRISGVAKASPAYYISIDQLTDVGVTTRVILCGINSKTHPDFRNLILTAGSRKVSGNIIMVSHTIQEEVGLVVGQAYDLTNADTRFSNLEVTIGGVFNSTILFGNKINPLLILIDVQTIFSIIPFEYRSLATAEIDVEVNNLLNIRKTGENIKDFVNTLDIEYWVFLEKDISEIEASGIRAYQAAMNLVVISSFIVEFLFITNILSIAIHDRKKEFGIFRAVGTQSFQLIGIITAEILIYSIIGSALGVVLGIGFSNVLVEILDAFYTGLVFESLTINFSSIFATFSSGLIVALIAGLYPIFLAIKTPVIQNIHSRARSGKSSSITNNWRITVGMGFILAITGFFLQIFIGPSRFLDFEILSGHFLVVILIFIGTILLEIGVLIFLPRIAMKLLIIFGLITRTISTRNIDREFQKSLFTIMTAALSLTFIIVVGLIASAVIAGVPNYFQDQWGSIDLVAVARDTNQPTTDFSSTLLNRNDIHQVSYIQETRTDLEGYNAYVYGVDPYSYANFAEATIECLDPERSKSVYEYLNESTRNYLNQTSGSVITENVTYGLISHSLYQRLTTRIPLGDILTIDIGNNETANITLAAVIRGNFFLGDGKYLYISSIKYQDFYNSNSAKYFLCGVIGSISRAQNNIEIQLDSVFVDVIGVEFYTQLIEQSLRFQGAFFQLLFVESFILAAIAQFICILVSTLRMEREMGIMRSMGLNKSGVFGIFISESTVLGVAALIIGLIDGLIGSILLAGYISLSIPISIEFPIERVVFWVLASFLITIASTILPSYRSSQKNIIATISGRPLTKIYEEKPKKIGFKWGEIKPEYKSSSVTILGESNQNQQKNYANLNDLHKQGFAANEYASESITFRKFIKLKRFEIQTIFLILMTIVTINYIFDPNIVLRGLNIFDTFWRSFFFITLITDDFWLSSRGDIFININPLLFIIGLSVIPLIVSYLLHGSNEGFKSNKIIVDAGFSFLSGLVALIVWYLFAILLSFIMLVFLTLISTLHLSYNVSQVLALGVLFFYMLCVLLLYQRIFYFFILRSVHTDLSFRERIGLLRKCASKKQNQFIILLMSHVLLQIVLNAMFFPTITPSFSTVNPIAFLILTVFEVGWYLFFIIYLIVIIINQNQPLLTKQISTSSQLSEKTNSLKTNIQNKEGPIRQKSMK